MSISIESSDSEKAAPDGSDQKILEIARSRFKLAEEAEQEMRNLFIDDMRFRAGEQWPDDIKGSRKLENRPCLVINKIPQSIQQITNDQRQNRPSIKVSPVDSMEDVETAKVIQGMIRHIEYNSNADVAYDRAFDPAATGGIGYFGFTTNYSNEMSFDQDIKFRSFPDPMSVYFDPHAQEPDGSDANWAFIVDKVSVDDFKMLYPDAEVSISNNWEMLSERSPEWVEKDTVRVAEYFYKETVKKKIALVRDESGQTVTMLAEELPQLLPIGVEVLKTRMAPITSIKWCKINGLEILEKTEWLGKYIPIIPVYGNEINIGGSRILEGIVRNAKDSQRMYNYWASAETEAIALAPKTPFIAAEGQLEGYENDWASANTKTHSVLIYKPTTVAGMPVPPPQRNSFEPAVSAITNARMLASEDMKATTGIYDASLGAKSNETSGVAIQRRNNQSQTSNFHFVDNLTRSMRHAGRVLIDLIPKIYDTERKARIIGDDDEERIVTVNGPFEENGKPVLYQLDSGKYDVTVNVGPSYATKRQEAVAGMFEVVRAYPQLAQFAGDLLVKNMDWPGAQEIAERLKKTLPPGIIDDRKGDKDVPPEIKAKLEQMSMMIQQLTEKLNSAHDSIDRKRDELESHERIEMKKLEVQLEIKRAEMDAKDGIALLSAEIAGIEQRMAMLQAKEDSELENDGADGAMSSQVPQPQPTGGESPGTNMEGN